MEFPKEPICVVIGRTRHKMVQMEIQEAARQGASLLEIRLDFLAKAPDFRRLLESKPCQMVATARRPVDGGTWKGTEESRQALLRQAIVAGFDWVDIETDIASQVRRFRDVRRIISYHNLREIPSNLEEIYERMCKQDADVVKIAVRAQHPMDNIRVLNLLRDAPVPTIAFCMGDMGIPSRILGAKFGAAWTYGAFNKERGLAPGLPSYDDLKRIYGYQRINRDTRIFGILGDPVAHSLSPLIHNQAFLEQGINAVYLPFRVPRNEFKVVLEEFNSFPVDGYSVTIPHKESAFNEATERNESVNNIKACNTLIRGESGFHGYNTDYLGFLDSLRYHLPRFVDEKSSSKPKEYEGLLQDRTVLILGAGGVARAVVEAVIAEGGLATIVNRTPERAQALAEEMGCRHMDWGARHSILADLLINCTSVGMFPELDASPIHPSFLKPGLTVFDTVYTPEQTLLVKEARKRGCNVITGVDLFVRQAALQFQLFTDQPAPVELMRNLVRRALSPVSLKHGSPLPPEPEESSS